VVSDSVRFCPKDGMLVEANAAPPPGLVACPACGREYPANVVFCPHDGSTLKVRIPQ